MIWELWALISLGILCSWIVFTDKIFSDVCMTKGCDIIRESSTPKLHGWMNFWIFVVGFMALLWLQLWFANSEIIGVITFTGSIYAIYMIVYSIMKFKTLCKFQLIYYLSMILLFLIWLSEFLTK